MQVAGRAAMCTTCNHGDSAIEGRSIPIARIPERICREIIANRRDQLLREAQGLRWYIVSLRQIGLAANTFAARPAKTWPFERNTAATSFLASRARFFPLCGFTRPFLGRLGGLGNQGQEFS
jgi:hypothetical protein